MITIKEFPGKVFENKDQALKELVENKKVIISQKKGEKKLADAMSFYGISTGSEKTEKADNIDLRDANVIKVSAVSNACNYFDSHRDVSIKGSWNRTAKNTQNGLHLQEHEMKFDKLISDDVTFEVKSKTWKDLGMNYEGSTDCLIMNSTVSKEDNPYMFNKYIQGKVKNHSAGLYYVSVEMAVNSEADWAKDEKAVWDKYYPDIINKEDVDDFGYFFAVIEQKIIENSAVLKGSNPATPTISVESEKESANGTSNKENSEESTSNKKSINLNFY